MTSPEIKNYERLQDDYKKLLSEYEEIKSNQKDDGNGVIAKKLEEIDSKHKEISVAFSKIEKKEN